MTFEEWWGHHGTAGGWKEVCRSAWHAALASAPEEPTRDAVLGEAAKACEDCDLWAIDAPHETAAQVIRALKRNPPQHGGDSK